MYSPTIRTTLVKVEDTRVCNSAVVQILWNWTPLATPLGARADAITLLEIFFLLGVGLLTRKNTGQSISCLALNILFLTYVQYETSFNVFLPQTTFVQAIHRLRILFTVIYHRLSNLSREVFCLKMLGQVMSQKRTFHALSGRRADLS